MFVCLNFIFLTYILNEHSLASTLGCINITRAVFYEDTPQRMVIQQDPSLSLHLHVDFTVKEVRAALLYTLLHLYTRQINILQQIYAGMHLLWQVCCSCFIRADVLRQICVPRALAGR